MSVVIVLLITDSIVKYLLFLSPLKSCVVFVYDSLVFSLKMVLNRNVDFSARCGAADVQ